MESEKVGEISNHKLYLDKAVIFYLHVLLYMQFWAQINWYNMFVLKKY